MGSSKEIIGYDRPAAWTPGFSRHEVATKYPLLVGGELRGKLMVVGFPAQRDLRFRLSILFPGPICRLDYADESHANAIDDYMAGTVPPIVEGPHYHSWPLNRRFFKGATTPPELHNAAPYGEPGRSFDSVLRWFCTDTKIDSLPPDHRIELPPPVMFI
jgi:hypothetical protein